MHAAGTIPNFRPYVKGGSVPCKCDNFKNESARRALIVLSQCSSACLFPGTVQNYIAVPIGLRAE